MFTPLEKAVLDALVDKPGAPFDTIVSSCRTLRLRSESLPALDSLPSLAYLPMRQSVAICQTIPLVELERHFQTWSMALDFYCSFAVEWSRCWRVSHMETTSGQRAQISFTYSRQRPNHGVCPETSTDRQNAA
jgi:hypothetical protein